MSSKIVKTQIFHKMKYSRSHKVTFISKNSLFLRFFFVLNSISPKPYMNVNNEANFQEIKYDLKGHF